jgi:hypothetical protein
LSGRQVLSAIRGDIRADGVNGDLQLEGVEGETLEAKVVDGQILARAVKTPVVRLLSTMGNVVFVGSLRPGGRYELAAYEGDVRVEIVRRAFSIDAHAGTAIRSDFAFSGPTGRGAVRGDFLGGGPSLELAAPRGTIFLTAAK